MWTCRSHNDVQRSDKVDAPGLVNFITAVAYHFCPNLPAAFTQPRASTLADLCILRRVCADGERACPDFEMRVTVLPLFLRVPDIATANHSVTHRKA